MIFEWDEEKANRNINKHKVDFEEAKTVFNDPLSITIKDSLHSFGENRFIDIGCSSKGRLLVVVYKEMNEIIRIISCRMATKSERKAYEEEKF